MKETGFISLELGTFANETIYQSIRYIRVHMSALLKKGYARKAIMLRRPVLCVTRSEDLRVVAHNFT